MWLEYEKQETESLEAVAAYIANNNVLAASFLVEEVIESIERDGGVEEAILLGNLACCVIILIEQVERDKKAIEHLLNLSRLHYQVGKMIECSKAIGRVAEFAPRYLENTTDSNEVFISDMVFYLYRQQAQRIIKAGGVDELTDFLLAQHAIWKERTRWIAHTILLDAIKQNVAPEDQAAYNRLAETFDFDPYLKKEFGRFFKTES
jgi:hypothetical protein